MENAKIIAIGDNVCDKYLSRGKMYPGGQCVNTCAYARLNDTACAYLGKFGSDEVAAYNQKVLAELGIDQSRCRHLTGDALLISGWQRASLARLSNFPFGRGRNRC